MTTREAKCGCGALTAWASGDPIRISVCQCLECKRRTGSAFSWNAHWPAAQVEIEGPFASYTRDSDDGYWGRMHFFARCGITVFYEIERRPGIISIPAGAFADPDFPAPQVEVYGEKRPSWLPELAPEQQ